ncbi:MAG: hypothetical protein IJE26_01145 [Oscillospiraceae bacterium]|nr:hypothetical protein [Oscillospiraceae bacterium]
MNGRDLLFLMGQIDEEHIAKALDTCTDEAEYSLLSERSKPMKKRILRTVLIAAVIASLMCMAVYAAGALINSPEQAVKVAEKEIERMKELGLLSEEVALQGEPQTFESPERQGDDYWYGRLFPHSYVVRWAGRGQKYFVDLFVDTMRGKIVKLTIEASADADDPVAYENDWDGDGTAEKYYANFDDVFPPELTIDEYCSLLSEYWEFDGYTLVNTEDRFYNLDVPPPDGSRALTSIAEIDNYYLTVFFEGDQSGAPMYIQLSQYPGRINFVIGTNHSVG